MNKETLKYRIEYALEHIYKYDIKGVHNLIHSIESRVI